MRVNFSKFNHRQTMSNSVFEIFHYNDAQPSNVLLHHHDFYEIYYLISGAMEYAVEGYCYRLEPGDLLLISPNELHHPNPLDSCQHFERVVIWLSPSYLATISNQIPGFIFPPPPNPPLYCSHLTLHGENRSRFNNVLYSLLEEIETPDSLSSSMQHFLISQLCIQICRLMKEQHNNVPSSQASITGPGLDCPHAASIRDIINYINSHLTEDLNLRLLSDRFFYDMNTLTRHFKKHTGVTVCEYIRKKRLTTARINIHHGMPAVVASLNSGFSDYSTFYRAFRQEYGISPKEYALTCKEPTLALPAPSVPSPSPASAAAPPAPHSLCHSESPHKSGSPGYR